VRAPIAFDLSLDLRTGSGRHWWSLVQGVAAQVHDETHPPHPLLSAALEHAVTAGLRLAAYHDHRAELATPVAPARPVAIRRAVELIESRPEAPLTVRDLADAAGVGVRTLQEGFRSALGTTPMRYLRDVRLARARQDLLAADADPEAITTVAYRWGFSHLGRFAEQYRAAYGESPTQTRLTARH
jgi:transcriptional regulator GlxA family with amidase domain